MKPASYQIDASGFVYERDSSMIFARMGTGKTLCNMMAMNDWLTDDAAKRIMVAAPLRVVENVWRQEAMKWGMPFSFGIYTGKCKQIEGHNDVILVNYENLSALLDTNHGCDAIVFDELSKLRNPTGKRQKATRRADCFKIRTGSTGTPTPNGLMSVYGMCQAVGLGHLVGKSFDKWKRQFFYPTDFKGHDWVAFKHTELELAKLLKPYTYILEDDAVELPPIVRPPIHLTLPTELREVYDRMRAQSVLSDLDIVAGSAGVLRNKLRQIASGFIYDNAGAPVKLTDWRLRVLQDIVDEQQGQPLIIAYEYREQLAMLRQRWPDAPFLGGGSKDNDKTIERWNRRELPLLFLHPASAGHGLNIQEGGNAIAWWTLPDDRELYDQTIGRLVRRGQANSHVFSYEPVAQDTVETAVQYVLGQKDTEQKNFWNALKSA